MAVKFQQICLQLWVFCAGLFVNKMMPPTLRKTWERSSELQIKTDNQVSKIMPFNTRYWMSLLWYARLHFSCFPISLWTKIFYVDNAPFKLESHLRIWVSAVFMAECHWKLAKGMGGKQTNQPIFRNYLYCYVCGTIQHLYVNTQLLAGSQKRSGSLK